jgi:hypothetical protein
MWNTRNHSITSVSLSVWVKVAGLYLADYESNWAKHCVGNNLDFKYFYFTINDSYQTKNIKIWNNITTTQVQGSKGYQARAFFKFYFHAKYRSYRALFYDYFLVLLQ